jgi:flagellar basal body P-ring protein FlgI
VEVEIFPRSGSLDNESHIEEGVTISELVEALHYLDMKPERIIQFLQNAINAGMINGKLLLK